MRLWGERICSYVVRRYSLPAHASDDVKVQSLLSLIRKRGHLVAQLDPLRRQPGGPWRGWCERSSRYEPLLASLLSEYKLFWTPEEKSRCLNRILQLQQPCHAQRTFHDTPESTLATGQLVTVSSAPLHVLVDRAIRSYCSYLSFEYSHLESLEQQDWLRREAEELSEQVLPRDQRWAILKYLFRAGLFESFLAEKFPSSKRFGLEGIESVIPGLYMFFEKSAQLGVNHVQIGMSHRGRLNVLHNLLEKPLGAVCAEMEGQQSPFRVGDVKYHLGMTTTKQLCSGSQMTVSLAPNPSHLEMIHPVVQGLVRALQRHSGWDVRSTQALLLHGDAAMAGLGIVPETLQLSKLPAYRIGGSVHVVINNQIGFTTMPEDGRSTLHATDCAKAAGIPVIHAYADCPESVVKAMEAAARWRHKYLSDVVVDICGYRRNGHNEQDDPSITLPLVQRCISQQPSVISIYSKLLLQENLVSQDDIDTWERKLLQEYESEMEQAMAGKYKENAMEFLQSHWQASALKSLAGSTEQNNSEASADAGQHADMGQYKTGLPIETIQQVARQLTDIPEGFNPHPDVEKLLLKRRQMVDNTASRVDFSFAELLAFCTLSLRRPKGESNSAEATEKRAALGLNYSHFGIRLSGQDSQRGTFNQRHAVMFDAVTRKRLVNMVHPTQDEVEVYNSPLSEAAVLAFEYGHSVASKDKALVLWEAQFGDFANNAQVIIDQFLSSGLERWGQESALVMLLPHGYDGQGPDHSSARLERFLSLVNDDPDHLPGYTPTHRSLIQDTFEAITREVGTKQLQMQHIENILSNLGAFSGAKQSVSEVMQVLWTELGLTVGSDLDAATWESFMVQFIRRQSECDANMFVVAPSTPAQYFHVLRRQANLPYKRPLICLTPKFLHHHRPATSALGDFTTGTFFNRVIDDGKGSDNTRHLARDRSGRPYLEDPERIVRVILCCGQIYYHLSNARRARKIANIVLVRLEQIAPFPHDIVLRVLRQYPNAELVWCQEEPKNQGAWGYVRPRLRAALLEEKQRNTFVYLKPSTQKTIMYIGRPVSATTATAAYWIHAQEQGAIIEEALQPGAQKAPLTIMSRMLTTG